MLGFWMGCLLSLGLGHAPEPPSDSPPMPLQSLPEELLRPDKPKDIPGLIEAQAERQRALEAARAARVEAEALLQTEEKRLLAIQKALIKAGDNFRRGRADLDDRRTAFQGWHYRVKESRSKQEEADLTYDALRTSLRASRNELRGLLALGPSSLEAALPHPGEDPLEGLPSDLPLAKLRELRRSILEERQLLLKQVRILQKERIDFLLEEITTLNQERLDLQSSLSATKRSVIMGFTAVGWDQARSEARHLALILQVKQKTLLDWIHRDRQALAWMDLWSYWKAGLWVSALLLAFWALRRRTPRWFQGASERNGDFELERPLRRRWMGLLEAIHRPAEWLILLVLVDMSLPQGLQASLEVQILSLILGWSLGGSLLVHGLHALLSEASDGSPDRRRVEEARLRTFRFLGRVVVSFALALALSARLVGKGTLHHWLETLAWILVLPVAARILLWWREPILVHAQSRLKPTWTQRWLLAEEKGWRSWIPLTLAALQWLWMTFRKGFRSLVDRFQWLRKAHALLLRHEMGRSASLNSFHPLSDGERPELGDLWQSACPSPQEEALQTLVSPDLEGRKAVFALVGFRGMGKSTCLKRLALRTPRSRLFNAFEAGFQDDWAEALRARESPTGLNAFGDSRVGEDPDLFLVDDAHALIRLAVGGLKTWDDLLASIQAHRGLRVVLALDAALWPFLEQARGDRLLLDGIVKLEAWSEGEIAGLLLRAQERLPLPLIYEGLDTLSSWSEESAPEEEREAIESKRRRFHRLIWHQARGNPGWALELWRASLFRLEDRLMLGSPMEPSQSGLGALPDSTWFVLKALLQMDRCTQEDLLQATGGSEASICNALGLAQTWIEETQGRLRIRSGAWGQIFLHLERRHFLAVP